MVDRSFDFNIKPNHLLFLSDYDHHPAEIRQSISSIGEMYPKKKISVLVQPHLYTRTRDCYQEFADSLSLADEVMLVDIYPAREQPIEGVNSELIYNNLRKGIEKSLFKKEDILNKLQNKPLDVLVVLGAGDIDSSISSITNELEKRIK